MNTPPPLRFQRFSLRVLYHCAVPEPVGGTRPKISGVVTSMGYTVSRGVGLSLQCPGQSYPVPEFRYRIITLWPFYDELEKILNSQSFELFYKKSVSGWRLVRMRLQLVDWLLIGSWAVCWLLRYHWPCLQSLCRVGRNAVVFTVDGCWILWTIVSWIL